MHLLPAETVQFRI